MAGLLGRILEPNPNGGLLDLAMNLAQQGGAGAPTMAGLATAGQATRQNMVQAREYQRQQAQQAIKDKAISQITDEDLKLLAQMDPSGDLVAQVMAARMKSMNGWGSEEPSSVREWRYYNSLSEDDKRKYLTMKRSGQIQDLGGSIVIYDPVSGKPVPLADKTLAPADVPVNAGNKAFATGYGNESGKVVAEKESNAPQAVSTADQVLDTLDKFGAHPGFSALYGWSGVGGVAAAIPSSDAAGAKSYLDQIGGQAFLQAYETLKGTGQITEIEGKKATDAITRLQNTRISAAEAKVALTELREVVSALRERSARNLPANAAPSMLQRPPGQRTVVKRQRNKTTGQERIVYSDGSTEIVQ